MITADATKDSVGMILVFALPVIIYAISAFCFYLGNLVY